MTDAPTLGVYIHWPYCARICPYCDFNVVRDSERGDEKAQLVAAIVADLAAHAALTGPRRLTSIFFGGGTPSLMDPAHVAQVVAATRALWTPIADLEVTLEANPTDAEAARFARLADAGVNRLSLGVQSLDDTVLKRLGRNHDAACARRAIDSARRAFRRLSVDLIYSLPGQSAAGWAAELRDIVALGPEHISPYQLTIETGTAFDRAVRRGAFILPDADLSADLYETTQHVLGAAGFDAYEVSNHAKGEEARSRHNLSYWRGEDYVGVGPGAHGRLTLTGSRWATAAPRGIATYRDRVREGGPGSFRERLSARQAAEERLLMGLRIGEGVALGDLAALEISADRFDRLEGFVAVAQGRLTVTERGRPLLDRIAAELAIGR